MLLFALSSPDEVGWSHDSRDANVSVFTKINSVPVSVGVVNQTIIAPFATRGEDFALIIIENLSATEVFNGVVASSHNGVSAWVNETNDAFLAMQPLTNRRFVLPTDRLNLRMQGYFDGAPGIVQVTVIIIHNTTWLPRQ
jgi:hypothetical protein